ncbi:SLBB domain-containing protein [Chitinispirillales bacterium ANBcel5]|uniref:SLBB domain-containing protein n=1 Tax=Cellulosispirillum alkaliphilum TaxID=3039283 RepID=UPI002A56368F|nr:SLBB domain-containing protein [Chitinispirillales bacterium ANBcel5]
MRIKGLQYIACNLLLLVLFDSFAQLSHFSPRYSEVELVPVTIHGAGVKAGTYYVPPALRVYDIITRASIGEIPDLRDINSRAVRVGSQGEVLQIDLLKFLNNGEYSHNPFINAGMSIHLDYAVEFAHVRGELKGTLTGRVPIAEGETVKEFLALFTFTSDADSSAIVLHRDGKEKRTYSLNELGDLTLKDKDFISVLPQKNVPRHSVVRVSGEAARPGLYSIIHGETPLYRIMDKAGGASPRGDINRAYLIRKGKVNKQPAEAFLAGQTKVRPEVTGGFHYLAASKDYAVIPISRKKTPLEDGDEIVIPPVEVNVYVSGSVRMPGAYPYSSGKSAGYYIQQAGGFTRTADRRNVKTITPFTNDAYTISEPTGLAAGDIIMVPEAKEDKWIRRWSPIISAAATVVSTVAIIVGMRN